MKVLCLGLDGATWDILKPLINNGKMPALGRLMKKGVYGELESTIPPVTGPAWVSLATGKNPGKTGVFDFINRKDENYSLHPATSRDFQKKAIWDYIAAIPENRVGIVNYPMLFPPYKINGFMVSNIAFSGKEDLTYPKDLKKEINEICDGYENSIDYHNEKYDDIDLFLTDLNRVLEKQISFFKYLLKKEWKLLFYVFSATDWVQHIMWKYIDKTHPLYKNKISIKYKNQFIKFWQKIDYLLEEIIDSDDDINILIVSDHGFGPQDECFNLFKWLEMKRYLIRKKIAERNKYVKIKKRIKPLLLYLGKTSLRRILPDNIIRKVRKNFLADIRDQIDFNKSRAYVLGHTIPFGAIYLNKNVLNTKESCRVIEELKMEIKNKLENLRDDVGQNVEVEIFNPENIYEGKYVDKAPDILFMIDNWRCIINETRPDDELFKNEAFSNRHTGSHRLNGVFLAHGPDIKRGIELKSIRIYDIAPTILHMFNLSIPKDMDGRVLTEIFRRNSKLSCTQIEYREKNEKEKIRSQIIKLKKERKV